MTGMLTFLAFRFGKVGYCSSIRFTLDRFWSISKISRRSCILFHVIQGTQFLSRFITRQNCKFPRTLQNYRQFREMLATHYKAMLDKSAPSYELSCFFLSDRMSLNK